MIEDDNVKLIREVYQSWNDSRAESVALWMNLLADNVEWRSIADGAPGMEFTRGCCSKDEVASYFQELGSEWEMLHYTADEFIAQGDRVVMIGSCGWRNKRTGKVVETPKADFIRMKNSKITEFYEFYDTAKALAASQ